VNVLTPGKFSRRLVLEAIRRLRTTDAFDCRLMRASSSVNSAISFSSFALIQPLMSLLSPSIKDQAKL